MNDTVTIPLALVGMFVFVAVSFVLFGAPEMERQARINQEIAYHD